MSAPTELVQGIPLFADLNKKELQGVASSMKERTFSAGQTIASEGRSGIDYFGEIALIDDGLRTASVTADSDLRVYGLTSWEFRPIVESNASIAWKLLKTMAARLREAEGRAGG